jgi:hypothetical protein
MSLTNAASRLQVVLRPMGPNELGEVIDAWYRSLIGSLAYMRPEQLRSEDDYRGFFRGVVVATRDLWVAAWQGKMVGVPALTAERAFCGLGRAAEPRSSREHTRD